LIIFIVKTQLYSILSEFPETVCINNFSSIFDSAKPGGNAIGITCGGIIKQIHLRNGEVKNGNVLFTYDQSTLADMELITVTNVVCDSPQSHVIDLENKATNVIISGLQVRNPIAENYFVYLKKALTALSITNSSYIGDNATKLIYTNAAVALSYLLHNCNLFPNMTTFRTGSGALAATVITDGSLGPAGKVTT